MDRSRAGLAMMALAPLAWLVVPFVLPAFPNPEAHLDFYHLEMALDNFGIGWAVTKLGFGISAWASPAGRPLWAGVGLAVAALAEAASFRFDFSSWMGYASVGLIVLGLGVAAVAVWLEALRPAAIGLSVVALVAVVGMLRIDLGDVGWQVGNALFVGGAILASLALWRSGSRRAREERPGPGAPSNRRSG